MDCSTPGFPIPHHLLEFAQVHVHWISDSSYPLSLSSPSAFNLSQCQGLFQRVCCWHQLSFSFSISRSNKYSGLISFRIDWFDLLVVQGTLKSLIQHHNLKASIHWHSAFFMAQLPHLYMTTEKIIALTTQNLLAKWYFCFLTSCLGWSSFSSKEQASFNFVATVTIRSDFGAQENKICYCFTFSPSICHELMVLDAMILGF